METFEIIKVKNETRETSNDLVIEEILLSIDINKNEFVSLLCTENNLKELVAGYLFTSSVINNINEIKNIKIINLFCEKWNAQVETDKENDPEIKFKTIQTSGCGKGAMLVNENTENIFNGKINSDLKIKPAVITGLMKTFQAGSETFAQTGGVHSSAIVYKEKIIAFMEDIGRHNAIDKIIGSILLNDKYSAALNEMILLTSGRISSEIFQKIYRCKIPVIISRSAPTAMAINISREKNITLIGFARGNKMNIYSGSHRINFEEKVF